MSFGCRAGFGKFGRKNPRTNFRQPLPAGRRIKNLRLCRLDAFENPQFTWVPQARVLDPTSWGGLASARPINWLPAGKTSVLQKVTSFANTAEVIEAVTSFMQAIYHALGPYSSP